jgi:hypothetical protein
MHFPGTWRAIPVFVALSISGAAGAAEVQRGLPTDNVNIAAASRGGRIVNEPTMLDGQKEYGPANLIDEKIYSADGKGSNGWVSNRYDPINMEEVIIGFKDNASRTIGRVVLNPSSYVARERWAKDIALEVSNDSVVGPYQSVAELTLKQSPEKQEFKFFPVQARFVKLRFRTNYGSDRAVALGEVEIYEAINTEEGLGGTIGRLEAVIAELEKWRKNQQELGPGASLQLISSTGSTPSNVNIASAAQGGKNVAVSSVFESERGKADPTYGADKIIDGRVWRKEDKDPSNGWSSQGFAPGQQWVILGFKDDRSQPIGKIVVNPMSYQPRDRWARRIELQVSNQAYKNEDDLKSFRTIKTLNLRTDNIPQEFELPPTEAKYVRLLFTANGPGGVDIPGIDPDVNSDRSVSLGEVEIYPPKATSSDLDSIIARFNNISSDLKRLRRANPALAALELPEADVTAETTPLDLPGENTEPGTPQVTTAQSTANTRIKTARTPTRRP